VFQQIDRYDVSRRAHHPFRRGLYRGNLSTRARPRAGTFVEGQKESTLPIRRGYPDVSPGRSVSRARVVFRPVEVGAHVTTRWKTRSKRRARRGRQRSVSRGGLSAVTGSPRQRGTFWLPDQLVPSGYGAWERRRPPRETEMAGVRVGRELPVSGAEHQHSAMQFAAARLGTIVPSAQRSGVVEVHTMAAT